MENWGIELLQKADSFLRSRWVRPVVFPLLLLLLNVYFVKELFTLEYSQYMGSIEAAYISISRYMMQNWRDLTWFPLWYGGIPFQNAYPPLLHAVVAVTAALLRISPAVTHHAVTAFFYCAGPVAVYALALRLIKSRWYSFWAGLAYSILSPSAFLIPQIRHDIGGFFGPRRYETLIVFGEGPHITSLMLLPLALLCLDLALTKRNAVYSVLAAVSMAAVTLSNWLGAAALALAVVAYLLAGLGADSHTRRWLHAVGIALLAYALACPWIPPSTVAAIRYNAQYVGDYTGVYSKLPLHLAILAVAVLVLRYLLLRAGTSKPLSFFVLFAFLTGAITLSAEWFGILVVPQPNRYHLEMELGICLVVPFAAKLSLDRLSIRWKTGLACAVLLTCGFIIRRDRRYTRNSMKPVQIAQTVEYQEAKWFDNHLNGARVMAPGAVSFWLNAFTDTPQLQGGFDQGIVNHFERDATYGIYAGDDLSRALLFLKAFGIRAVAIGGPNSREQYKPVRHPEIFRTLEEAWRQGDDAIHWVPLRSTSLAHIVTGDAVVPADAASSGINLDRLRTYVAALDDPNLPLAEFRWTTRHSATIHADVEPNQVISVQVAFHPGWHVSSNGVACLMRHDGMGQIVIEPGCHGPCGVELVFDGGLEMRVAHTVGWISLAGSLLWIALSALKIRRPV